MDGQTIASSSLSSSSGPGSSPPPPEDAWIDSCRRLLPKWQSCSHFHQPVISIAISRVNQVDAARLNIEMSGMLKEQLVRVFSLMKFSIWVRKPTPAGNALMNLRYRDKCNVEARGKDQVWRDLDLLLHRRFGILLPLLAVNISGDH